MSRLLLVFPLRPCVNRPMRTRYTVGLIVLLAISAAALLSIYRPNIYLHPQKGVYIQFIAEETMATSAIKIHSLALTTKGFVSSHNVYHQANVFSVTPLR